ncbi:hypothetical protein GLOIN_2v1766411 [Rhizophagus irregularis DAOM 181602=DAOM 197198]|nr:hypothetical protein GLOIN_2v1766411 [Rhizophagus irregularis DAOM 181602=DAOM 197198]
MDCCEYVNENSTTSDEENELHIILVLGAKFQTWEVLEGCGLGCGLGFIIQIMMIIRRVFVNDKSNIVCSNPVTSRRCGRPPNQYLSEGKTASKNKKQKITIDLELQCISENNNNGNNKKVMIYV